MFNVHTHRIPTDSEEQFVLNCNPGAVPLDVKYCSVGLHPWCVDTDWREQVAQLRRDALLPNVVAIGECGLDAMRGIAKSVQIEAFRAQIELSQECRKPLIIHCVRSFDLLFQLHREYSPHESWMVHGFRGKPQLAMQLVGLGIQLSFGLHFNPDTLKMLISSGKSYFLETDDEDVSLREVIEKTRSLSL